MAVGCAWGTETRAAQARPPLDAPGRYSNCMSQLGVTNQLPNCGTALGGRGLLVYIGTAAQKLALPGAVCKAKTAQVSRKTTHRLTPQSH